MRYILSVTAIAVLLMGTAIFASPVQAANAPPATAPHPYTACNSGRSDAYPPMNGYSGYMDLINVGHSSCSGGPANSNTYAANCSGRSYWTAQADTWLTQQPYSGGHRNSESGRSGLVSYPNNCVVYSVNGTSEWFPPSPLWSCAWWYVKESNWSVDYVCNSGAG